MNEETISLKEDEQKQRKEYSCYGKQSSYGILPWKIGAVFFLAHSFAFFLEEIQLSEQQQNLDHRSQCVYAG